VFRTRSDRVIRTKTDEFVTVLSEQIEEEPTMKREFVPTFSHNLPCGHRDAAALSIVAHYWRVTKSTAINQIITQYVNEHPKLRAVVDRHLPEIEYRSGTLRTVGPVRGGEGLTPPPVPQRPGVPSVYQDLEQWGGC